MFKRLESTRLHATLILVLLAVLATLVLIQIPGEEAGLYLSRFWIIGALTTSLLLLLFLGHRYHVLYLEELSQKKERFRSTFEQAAVGMAHVSVSGQILAINNRFCEIVGYTKSEMLNRSFQDITHLDDLQADLAHVQDLMDGKSLSYSLEKRYLRKGGETVWVNMTVSLLRDDAGRPRWFVSVVEDISARKLAEAKVRLYQKRLQGLIAELGNTAEKERARIAVALHDSVVQSLASALMKLDLIGNHPSTTGHDDNLLQVSGLLRQCILEINGISADLNPPSLSELGLSAAINEWMTENLGKRHGIQAELVDLRDDGDREDPENIVWHLLYRNVRELLANVVRHSQATRVRVFLREVEGNLVLEVNDNGAGCIPEDALRSNGEGIGLFAIEECMAELGGALKIDSVTGHGFSATMILPVPVRIRSVDSSNRMTA